MEAFTIQNLSFGYPNQENKVLDDISFTIKQGEFVTLCGISGSGKTTLLRQLKTTMTPHGNRKGRILFKGAELGELDFRTESSKIGFVQQNPDNQLVTDKVWHELAFGLENLGYSQGEIQLKVAEMASFFGIQEWFYRDVHSLSGGQKQLLNLAAIMAMSPDVLILDEPTSQLDPIAASEFLAVVGRVHKELGVTVIMTEHRLEEVLPLATRMMVLDKGRVLADNIPSLAAQELSHMHHDLFEAMPTPMRIYSAVKNEFDCPLTVQEGRDWLNSFEKIKGLKDLPDKEVFVCEGQPLVEIDKVWFKYEKEGKDILKGLSLKAYKGQLLAIVGGNGTGKSTALSLISGVRKPYRGNVKVKGEDSEEHSNLLGVLPQNPQVLFVKKTVYEDLVEMLYDYRISDEEKKKRINYVTGLCHLKHLWERHPYDLSGGEQQRLALAKVLLLNPKILILDEPTKGLDAQFKQGFASILNDLLKRGVSIIMVSHDIEFCAKYAHHCALLFDGKIVSTGDPEEFFTGNTFYTTAANRMARHLLPKAITAEDVIVACGGDIKPKFIENNVADDVDTDLDISAINNMANMENNTKKKASKEAKDLSMLHIKKSKADRRSIIAAFLILLLIPATIYIGVTFLDDRRYQFISLLVILEAMIPFALIFEGRKPQARELVAIAVICALAVVGRLAFFMVPQFKPMIAITIVAGVSFGRETGFLVGSISAFASNFFYGQGPWTPWQMFACGIIGFLAGWLFEKGFFKRSLPVLAVFGIFSTFLVYGLIMNTFSATTLTQATDTSMLLTTYMLALPFDLIHAAATGIFLWLIARPLLEKLDRIKVKYGLVE